MLTLSFVSGAPNFDFCLSKVTFRPPLFPSELQIIPMNKIIVTRQGFAEMQRLPQDPDWSRDFTKWSIFPPIAVQKRLNRYEVIDGHHRIILWRAWGFTQVPAFVRKPQ
jgi:hypothetical protein